jgi:hypothetical protein
MMNIATAASWIVSETDAIADHLKRYFQRHEDLHQDVEQGFTGRLFEKFIAGSERSRFTASDMLAVSALGVTVPPHVAEHLIDDVDGRWSRQLAAVSEAVARYDDLADMPEKNVESGPLSELYDQLKMFRGLGFNYVTQSKLLAAKFPSHVPIRDRRVEDLLELTGSTQWWAPMRELIRSQGVREALMAVVLPDDIEVTTLRRLDVVLWMEHRTRESAAK